MSKKNSVASQAAFKANVTRKKAVNQRLYERGSISLGTLRARNANITRAAVAAGMRV